MGSQVKPPVIRSLRRALQRGELVFLRFPTRSDAEELLALRAGNRRHLERWEPIPPPGFDAFGQDYVERELKMCRRKDNQRLLICRMDDGAIVGRVQFSQIIRGPLQQCFVGYWIGRQFTRRGYMTEALRLAQAHAFETLRLHRIEANIQPHNEASKRAAANAGFRLEGFSPRYLQIRGTWADHERWAVTKEDWERHGRVTNPRRRG